MAPVIFMLFRSHFYFTPNPTTFLLINYNNEDDDYDTEMSTGRMDPRVGSGRDGSGRVTILLDFGGSGPVGSALGIF